MNKNFSLPGVRVAGFFKLEKTLYKKVGSEWVPNGNPVCVAEFQNLITNQGLNEIGTRLIDSSINTVQVGSGNSPPAPSDSGLVSVIATSSTQQTREIGSQTETAPFYRFVRRTVRFGIGAAAGNLSEVGVGWGAGNNLFSRALIQDAFGSPTTITVLPTEVLDVTYELRILPPESDFISTLTLGNGVTYDVTARPADISSGFLWRTGANGSGSSASQNRAYSGEISDTLSLPNGTSSGGLAQLTDYENNSLEGTIAVFFDLNNGNVGGIRSVVLSIGFTGWQFEFSSQVDGSPIPKDESSQFTFGATMRWSRRDTQ